MGIYKIDNHVECENCSRLINRDEFAIKLRLEYQILYAWTKWGPSIYQCPNCEHLNEFKNQRPFYKMRWHQKGWTILVMLIYTLFLGLITIPTIGVVWSIVTHPSLIDYLFERWDDNFSKLLMENLVPFLMFTIPPFLLIFIWGYWNPFFRDDKRLD